MAQPICIESQLLATGSDVVATGTCSDEMQEVTLRTFRRLSGRVSSTAEVIAEMNAGPAA